MCEHKVSFGEGFTLKPHQAFTLVCGRVLSELGLFIGILACPCPCPMVGWVGRLMVVGINGNPKNLVIMNRGIYVQNSNHQLESETNPWLKHWSTRIYDRHYGFGWSLTSFRSNLFESSFSKWCNKRRLVKFCQSAEHIILTRCFCRRMGQFGRFRWSLLHPRLHRSKHTRRSSVQRPQRSCNVHGQMLVSRTGWRFPCIQMISSKCSLGILARLLSQMS